MSKSGQTTSAISGVRPPWTGAIPAAGVTEILFLGDGSGLDEACQCIVGGAFGEERPVGEVGQCYPVVAFLENEPDEFRARGVIRDRLVDGEGYARASVPRDKKGSLLVIVIDSIRLEGRFK